MLISEAQERGEIHKLLPQTHTPGVDYSLFIMETVEMLLEKMETMSAAPCRSFPPPICSSSSLFWCFCVSAALSSGKRRGTIFIVGFRSRRNQGDKDRWHRSHEGENGVPHTARESGHVGPPNFLLRLPFSRIIGSYVFFLPNIGPRKILGHLDVVWVPESQKHGKRVFWFCRVNSK